MVQEAKPNRLRCLPWEPSWWESPYEDCAVFEDSQAGIEAANRAGMYSIVKQDCGVC